jgi:hypothetical protein
LGQLFLIEPGAYRAIDEIVGSESKGQGSIEIVDTTVHEIGDDTFDDRDSAAPAADP